MGLETNEKGHINQQNKGGGGRVTCSSTMTYMGASTARSEVDAAGGSQKLQHRG